MGIFQYLFGGAALTFTGAKLIENDMESGDVNIQAPPDNVTIIIPALNEEKFIEKHLKSLREQSIVEEYPEYFEYILVDSQSIDEQYQSLNHM